ncbi:hypothetical protein LX36DRAFT_649952 [Colletotrichum falcatum]|nr:hypothetical protein LX36DRAFT_649952 [Colletotrichum falcatum]
MRLSTSSGWRASFSGLLVLLTLAPNAAAQELGIALDKAGLDDANLVFYSTKLTFERDTRGLFTDDQLYGLAKTAFDDMRTLFPVQRIHAERQPVMMAAMAVGEHVYLSSDLKGGPFLYNDTNARVKPDVALALDRCQTALQQETDVPDGQQRRSRASCAEVFAVYQYYLDPDLSDAARKDHPPARIVAYGKPGMATKGKPQGACGGGGGATSDGVLTWGCEQFMDSEGIAMPNPPEPASVTLPVPLPPFTGKQVSIMCPGCGR